MDAAQTAMLRERLLVDVNSIFVHDEALRLQARCASAQFALCW